MLFIDANQYLNLFRMDSGKKLLAALEEQDKYIFVTEQIVNEVGRNKVRVAASFMATKQLKLDSIAVPDHILSTTDSTVKDMRKQLREIDDRVKKAKEDFRKLAHDLLEQIVRSEDEVSNRLAAIFSHAVIPTTDEVRLASHRKRFGNPPGKKTDALGDQISWEQLLSDCERKIKDKPKLWIITSDSDYVTEHADKMFLNSKLYSELAQLYGSTPEVFCFDNILDAVKHFTETTKVKADNLPTPQETKEIKKEQANLSLWLRDYDDGGFSVFQNNLRFRESPSLRAILGNQFRADETVLLPFVTPETDEKP
jgi:hypothetical protein